MSKRGATPRKPKATPRKKAQVHEWTVKYASTANGIAKTLADELPKLEHDGYEIFSIFMVPPHVGIVGRR
jgi:hypothetical protein